MGCINSIIPEHLKIHIMSPCFRRYCSDNTCQCDIELDNSDNDDLITHYGDDDNQVIKKSRYNV